MAAIQRWLTPPDAFCRYRTALSEQAQPSPHTLLQIPYSFVRASKRNLLHTDCCRYRTVLSEQASASFSIQTAADTVQLCQSKQAHPSPYRLLQIPYSFVRASLTCSIHSAWCLLLKGQGNQAKGMAAHLHCEDALHLVRVDLRRIMAAQLQQSGQHSHNCTVCERKKTPVERIYLI